MPRLRSRHTARDLRDRLLTVMNAQLDVVVIIQEDVTVVVNVVMPMLMPRLMKRLLLKKVNRSVNVRVLLL